MRSPTLSNLSPPPAGKAGWPWTVESPQLSDTMPNGAAWPRISIVTPSFNQGRFIEETIRSVLLQGYPDLEYVVMDGGSSDESSEIITRYSPWLSFWRSFPDGGQSAAISEGFSRTTGSVMAWINSDDFYLPNVFKFVTTRLALGHSNLLTGSQFSLHDSRRELTFGPPGGEGIKPSVLSLLLLAPQLHQAATFWTRELWETSGAKLDRNLKYAMDADLWFRFFACGATVQLSHYPLAVFRGTAHRRPIHGIFIWTRSQLSKRNIEPKVSRKN